MPDKRPDPPDLEISWRTEELGPETRRRLFEKLVPSGRPAAEEPAASGRAAGRERPASPAGKPGDHSEKPKTPRAPKTPKADR